MSFIDWNASELPSAIQGQQTQNQNAALDLIQKQRAINALSGVNFNDPASVQNALTGSVRVGAIEQANALNNLSWNRMLNQANGPNVVALAQRFNQHINQQPGSQSSDAPAQGQAPSQTPSQAPAQPSPDLSPDQLGHAQGVMQAATSVVKEMQSAPDAGHAQAVLTARTPELLAMGVPQAAIDSVASHLQDSNFSSESLGSLLDHYQAHADNFGGMAQGQPRADNLSQHPADMYGPGTDIAQGIVTDPFLMDPINQGYASKYLGIDLSPGVNSAITQMAERRAAPFSIVSPTDSLGQQHQMSGANWAAGQAQPGAQAVVGPSTFETAERTAAAGAPYTGVTTNTGPGGAPETQSATQFATGRGAPTFGPHGEIGGAPANAPPLTGVSPAQGQANVASGQQYATDLASAGRSQPMQVALRKVIDLLPNTNVGPGVAVTNGWRSFIMSQLPVLAPLIPGGLTQAQVQTANTNELEKYMVQIAGAQAAQYGPGTDSKLTFASSGNPHLSMDKASALDVSRMALALQRADMAKPYLFSTTHQDPGQYSTFASNYARTVDPRAFMLDLLPPPDRTKLIASITSPQDRERFMRGVQAAEAAGFYTRADLPR